MEKRTPEELQQIKDEANKALGPLYEQRDRLTKNILSLEDELAGARDPVEGMLAGREARPAAPIEQELARLRGEHVELERQIDSRERARAAAEHMLWTKH